MIGGRTLARLGSGVALLLAACSPPSGPGDILLITVDTLRADHLGLYGYERPTSPRIDALFREAAIFERAYSGEANTSPAVASLLTGLLPQEHRVRLLYQHLPEEQEILTDLLPEAYQSAAFVSNPVLTDEAIGLARHFDHYDDRLPKGARRRRRERDARDTTDAAIAWLERERDANRPLFLWVHYIDPHAPYAPPPDWQRRFEHDGSRPSHPNAEHAARKHGVDDLLELVDLYDEEIAYMDEHVGRLLDRYAELRPIEEALILFTADHGESMMEHEYWFAHGYQVYNEIIQVPLMIRGPGVAEGRRRGLASTLDVPATLLGFAGIGSPSTRSYDLRHQDGPADRSILAEATLLSHWRTSIRGDDKRTLRLDLKGREIKERRHYELDRDPGETRASEVAADSPAWRELEELVRSDPDPGGVPEGAHTGKWRTAPKVVPNVSEEQLEILRELGYAN